MCHMSHVMCHVSHVMCHMYMSHVTCQVLHDMCQVPCVPFVFLDKLVELVGGGFDINETYPVFYGIQDLMRKIFTIGGSTLFKN